MRYLDLNTLTVREEDTLDVRCCFQKVEVWSGCTLSKMGELLKPHCDLMRQGLTSRDAAKVHSFAFELRSSDGVIDADEFESFVNVCLSWFFAAFVEMTPRAREKRLDVPENLKQGVNCSLSLLKRAINYTTPIDKFNITIRCGDLRFELVGEENA
jgi:hypothetical protein